eukprot:4293541-Prymnesium_polylepis.3
MGAKYGCTGGAGEYVHMPTRRTRASALGAARWSNGSQTIRRRPRGSLPGAPYSSVLYRVCSSAVSAALSSSACMVISAKRCGGRCDHDVTVMLRKRAVMHVAHSAQKPKASTWVKNLHKGSLLHAAAHVETLVSRGILRSSWPGGTPAGLTAAHGRSSPQHEPGFGWSGWKPAAS